MEKANATPVMGMDRGCNIISCESRQTSIMVFLYERIYRTFEKEELQMNERSCAPSCKAENWESIDWNKAHAYVKKLQMRIVKAQQEGHYSKVKTL